MEEEQDETRKEEGADSKRGEEERNKTGKQKGKDRSEKRWYDCLYFNNFYNLHALLETVPHIIRKQSKL